MSFSKNPRIEVPALRKAALGQELVGVRRNNTKIVKPCLNCGLLFSIPACRDWREHCCSSECKKAIRDKSAKALEESRTRKCKTCGKEFVVKKSQVDSGHGKFCSHNCTNSLNLYARTEIAGAKRVMAFKIAIEEGRYSHPCGEKHPLWRGGHEAAKQRSRERRRSLTESGESKKRLREYRQRNPEKVREWAASRGRRKHGRLPSGTVARIKKLQRGKCAVCHVSILKKYHVDHIMPLALEGKHKPNNIQILCPTCNVRKSAKNPIDFMQSRGFLL